MLVASLATCLSVAAGWTPAADSGAADAPAPKVRPKVIVTKPVPRKPQLPPGELTEQVMFKMMLAEIAVQRGQPHVAVPAYLELARETRDPRIAQRATEIAWNARFVSAAIEAAGIWQQADPESPQARQVLVTLLVNQSQLSEAQPHLEKWLAADRAAAGQNFAQLSKLFERNQDRAGVLRLMQALAKPYRDVPEARLAVAQAALNAGEQQVALDESAAAVKIKPDWELAALFHAQALQRRSNAEALAYLEQYVKANPGARDSRLNYARLLANEKRYPEARREFEALLGEFPQNVDVTMAVALLAMQAGDLDAAERQYRRLLEMGYKDPDAVRVQLGQIHENRKNFDEALRWYGAVKDGEQFVPAQARYAGILARQGKLDAARRHLQQLAAKDGPHAVAFVQAEAQLLRDAQAYQDAFDLLGEALARRPDSPELLYDHAMAAEKVNRIAVLETNLRRLIELRPNHAHAYNALGYTLADRNERLDEARGLIEAALKLAPEDPFIIDSMGWVLYRLGRPKEGLEHLQRAYKMRPDAEIAAHVGEVLWVLDRRDEAQKVWGDALKAFPGNDALQNTIKRYAPVFLPAAR